MHGVVVGISPTEVYVDVGRKQAGFIPASELSNDPNAKPEDLVKIGDEMDLLIMKTNDQEGTIMLSKRRVDAMKGWDEISQALENNEVLEGKVIEVVKGGVIVLYKAMRIFVPASQATASRGEDLNELMGKDVKFRIIEVNRQRRRAVGSIRSVLREERKAAQEKFWEQVEEGQQYTGKVKSLTNFGAFVDLGGVDGMVHISELSWNRIKHPSEVLKVGDTVDVYVKGLDRENGKISLGYKRPEDNPWVKLEREYPVGTVCDAKIVGMTQFGAFASVIPGIDGLIHISQMCPCPSARCWRSRRPPRMRPLPRLPPRRSCTPPRPPRRPSPRSRNNYLEVRKRGSKRGDRNPVPGLPDGLAVLTGRGTGRPPGCCPALRVRPLAGRRGFCRT